ncbi:diguanylate cyclase [Gammaproteobacteria bacterium]
MWRSLQNDGSWQGEIWDRRKSSEVYPELLSIATVRDAMNRLQHYVGVFSDITWIKAHEAELERIAHYDPLTGVPNRRLLADRLKQAIVRTQRTGKVLAICYLDLDGFKPINDQFGHEVGDQLLVEVTRQLREILRVGDTLARLGGDEFVLLFGDLNQEEECSAVLQRVLSAVATPFVIKDTAVTVSASIGVTLYPYDAADADTLLRHADQAMYLAKEAGKNRFHRFDAEHDRRINLQRELLQSMEKALVRDEFVLYYQPQINLTTGEVIGVEAFLRWQHPERGLLNAREFLPPILGTELEIAIGAWVIETALRQMETWQAIGLRLRVSVNIGAHHLQQANFAEWLQSALERHPVVSANDLVLEIMESTAINDLEQVSERLATCLAKGIHIALDDFGTGYSSLVYFYKLPVDTLKIDQTFVHDLLDDPEDLGIVESVVRLAKVFNRAVIAEGVESWEHGALLVRLGCRFGQGYGIARPMSSEQLPMWLIHWREQAAWRRLGEISLPTGDLTLMVATTSHRNWVASVISCINNPTTAERPPLHSHHCRFGRWYHGSGFSRYRGYSEFTTLQPLHERIHVLAEELLTLTEVGQRQMAQTRLPELLHLRDDFLAGLCRLVVRVS